MYIGEAERVVVVQQEGQQEGRNTAQYQALCTLTPEDKLDRTFPAAREGTLYCLFAKAEEPVRGKVLCLVKTPVNEGVRTRAFREAALGMMDNPIYR
jgi:hypothetical protein